MKDKSTQHNYSPFGITEMLGEASENPFKYTAREDDGTGLYYYRARHYSPMMGRFVSEDPIGFAGGDVNFYSYVGSNPVNWIDPLGLIVYNHGHTVNRAMQRHLTNLSNISGLDIHITSGTRNKPGANPKSQHYTGNAADFYMATDEGEMIDMAEAACITADYDNFTGVGYYSGEGEHGAHVHADLREGPRLYWSETDYTGYRYNNDSPFWNSYLENRNIHLR